MDIEYDLILGEDDEEVLFLIRGREVKLPRSQIESFDYEGRLVISAEVAAAVGLSDQPSK